MDKYYILRRTYNSDQTIESKLIYSSNSFEKAEEIRKKLETNTDFSRFPWAIYTIVESEIN